MLFGPERRDQRLRERPRLAMAAANYRRAAAIAAEAKGVRLSDVLSTRRRKGDVAEARQLAAYLTVMVFGISRRQVARLIGRNFMVVSRLCAAVEEARDEPAFETFLAGLEAQLQGERR